MCNTQRSHGGITAIVSANESPIPNSLFTYRMIKYRTSRQNALQNKRGIGEAAWTQACSVTLTARLWGSAEASSPPPLITQRGERTRCLFQAAVGPNNLAFIQLDRPDLGLYFVHLSTVIALLI